MNEVDRGVGLQQVAPGALARMRFARDEQHAQPVAHAFDHGHGAVVLRARSRRRAAERRSRRCSGRHDRPAPAPRRSRRAIDLDRHRLAAATETRPTRGLPGPFASSTWKAIVCSLPTMPKRGALSMTIWRSRSVFEPVMRPWTGPPMPAFDGSAGASWTWPSVIITRAGEALGRNVGQRAVQRIEGAGAVVLGADAGAHFHDAEFGVGQGAPRPASGLPRPRRCGRCARRFPGSANGR